MCGIAGLLGCPDGADPLQRMVAALGRRGPDDSGMWIDQSAAIGLGHTRLSIIDTSTAGHQPMTHGGGRYWITLNGEIYNYREIAEELGDEAGQYHSGTDTEVIIAAFARWGTDAFCRLRGMFAFGLWDMENRRLYLVRDRFGIKPLLWAESGRGFVFASELSALLASGLVPRAVDPAAVVDLLATGSVLQPRTILRNVFALEPATCMVITADGSRESLNYWDLNSAAARLRPSLARLDYQELVQMTRSKLLEATRYHLVADVPVGSFLSGGIDSTTITALMTTCTGTPVQTFSIGYAAQAEGGDELPSARLAARRFGSIHTELVLTGADVAESLADYIDAIDQPSSDGLNTYFVSRLAGGKIKVALSGLGGDELFAGYSHFSVLSQAESRPSSVADRLRQALHGLRPNRWTYIASLRGMAPLAAYATRRRFWSDSQLATHMNGVYRQALQPAFFENYLSDYYDPSVDLVARTSAVELRSYMLNTLLRDSDAVSMHHSLEMRPVLLDHPLVEFALALPMSAKLRDGRTKSVLIDAAHDLLPSELLVRPKSGFTLPLYTWLRTALRPQLRSCLASPLLRSVLTEQTLRQLAGGIDDSRNTLLLWTLLVLWLWCKKHHCAADL